MPIVKIEQKTDYSLRPASSEDRENIKSFYKQYIWKHKDAEFLYRWKYDGNPFDETVMWVGIDSSGTIISNAVFMPWQFCLNGKAIKATQAADGVIKLEYRGQGISLEQYNRGMKDAMERGALLCFAFPNENGAAVHRKNNGIHLGSILRYTKPLRTEYLVSRVTKSKLLSKVLSFFANLILRLFSRENYILNINNFRIEKIENCGNEFNDFWARFCEMNKNKIITNKDSVYLNWKYLNSQNKNRQLYSMKKDGAIYGFIVLESAPKIGYIVDILAYDKKTLEYLIAYSIKYFRKQGKDSVVFIALENNIYFSNFESFGFVKRPEQKHFYIYLNKDIKNMDFFMDSKNWFITIGDCDIERL